MSQAKLFEEAKPLKENEVLLNFSSVSNHDFEEMVDKKIDALNRNRGNSSSKLDLVRALDEALETRGNASTVYLIAKCEKRDSVRLLTKNLVVDIDKLEDNKL